MTSAQGRTPRFRIMPPARALILCALALAAAVGCRYRDPSIELLEGELRWMEDQLYMLEDELQSTSAQLAECQGQNCSCPPQYLNDTPGYAESPEYGMGEPIVIEGPQVQLPAEPTPAERGGSGFEREPPSSAKDQTMRPPADVDEEYGYEIVEPSVEIPEGESYEPDEMSPPVEPRPLRDGGGLSLPGEAPRLSPSPSPQPIEPMASQQSPDSPFNIELQSFHEPAAFVANVDASAAQVDAHVTHIVAHGRLSGGYDFDNYVTADDLLVVIEPRNAAGQYVALAGPISVVALDGTKTGADARISRWDFDAAEARRRIRESNDGKGIHLQLAWPDEKVAPKTDKILCLRPLRDRGGSQVGNRSAVGSGTARSQYGCLEGGPPTITRLDARSMGHVSAGATENRYRHDRAGQR